MLHKLLSGICPTDSNLVILYITEGRDVFPLVQGAIRVQDHNSHRRIIERKETETSLDIINGLWGLRFQLLRAVAIVY
jgi:hypothetical protein